MQDHKVAQRYAAALFNEAEKNQTIESVESDLSAIANLIQNGTQFKDFLYSPRIGREEKIRIAEAMFSDRVTALTMQFVRLVLVKRREAEFDAMRDEYVNLRRAHGKVIFAEIISAEPLDAKLRAALERKLSEKTGKRIEAAYDVDASLIGGVRVQYGNYVLDGSIKGSLGRLRDSWRHDVLKQI